MGALLTRMTTLVRGLLLVVIALDSVLVGWLVFSAETLREWITGALISILIPGVLYGILRLLESLTVDGSGQNDRHGKHH